MPPLFHLSFYGTLAEVEAKTIIIITMQTSDITGEFYFGMFFPLSIPLAESLIQYEYSTSQTLTKSLENERFNLLKK